MQAMTVCGRRERGTPLPQLWLALLALALGVLSADPASASQESFSDQDHAFLKALKITVKE